MTSIFERLEADTVQRIKTTALNYPMALQSVVYDTLTFLFKQ